MRILRIIACAAGIGPAFVATASANEMMGPPPGTPPARQLGGATPQATNPSPRLELLYTPIAPCRALATALAGGVIAANTTRTFIVAGASNFSAQGGPTRGCGVPGYATAVSMSFTTANSGTGFLRAFAAGAAVPPTQVLSYRSGVTTTASQNVQIRAGRITVGAYTAATNVAGDVTGYYAPQMYGLIYTGGGSNAIFSGSPAILSVEKISTGIADVTLDRDVTYCMANASAYIGINFYANASALNGAPRSEFIHGMSTQAPTDRSMSTTTSTFRCTVDVGSFDLDKLAIACRYSCRRRRTGVSG